MSDCGWVRAYRALGLRNRADWIPVTDPNTLTDAMRFNMPANNLNTILAREGRTMGQAVLDVLSGSQNQAWLGGIPGISPGYGIGNYTSQGYGGGGTGGPGDDDRDQQSDGGLDLGHLDRLRLHDSSDRRDSGAVHEPGHGDVRTYPADRSPGSR